MVCPGTNPEQLFAGLLQRLLSSAPSKFVAARPKWHCVPTPSPATLASDRCRPALVSRLR